MMRMPLGENSSALVPGEGKATAVVKESSITSLECPSQEGLMKDGQYRIT